MSKCEFCLKLKEMVKNRESIFSKKSDEQIVAIIESIEKTENNGTVWGRGCCLCPKHLQTIKRDNKYRILKGIDIPENLDTLRLLVDDY